MPMHQNKHLELELHAFHLLSLCKDIWEMIYEIGLSS